MDWQKDFSYNKNDVIIFIIISSLFSSLFLDINFMKIFTELVKIISEDHCSWHVFYANSNIYWFVWPIFLTNSETLLISSSALLVKIRPNFGNLKFCQNGLFWPVRDHSIFLMVIASFPDRCLELIRTDAFNNQIKKWNN
jgi:hypothetical protein